MAEYKTVSGESRRAAVNASTDSYCAIGGAAGCRALAAAFYAHVARDPVLRPLFPSTFRCAIEQFSAFLVQFLGGEAAATQDRWWLSLRESHERFPIGPDERSAWLRAMAATLEDESLPADSAVRGELLGLFSEASAHLVNTGRIPVVEDARGELAALWEEQVALDEAIALARSSEGAERCLVVAQGLALQRRFARCPAVHAGFVAVAAKSGSPLLREYAWSELRARPALVHEHYSQGRILLHDAVGAGDVALVELLLDLGSVEASDADRALYCLGNECSAPGAGRIVRILVQRASAGVHAVHGVKRCTALHMAARRGNVDVISALLDEGADIEARDSMGDTPLRRAVNCDKVDAARALLSRGADARSRGSKALTPALAARGDRMRRLFYGAETTSVS